MSRPRTHVQTPSARDLVPRNRLGAQDRRAASTDGPTPYIQTVKKTREEQGKIPVQQQSSLLPKTSPQLSGNSFDPRSILPDTKSKKTLARLQEASSANKPATLQPTTFNCIDGVSRTIHPLPPKPTASNGHRPCASQPSARVPFRVDAAREAPREQFTAFGIEAFPTRALFDDICYDFVKSSRWCSKGNHCVRIHPLNKSKYLAHVIEQSVKVSRLNLYDYSDSEEDERDTPTLSFRKEQSTERVSSPGAERSQSSPPPVFYDPPIKVKLPPPPPSPMSRQCTPPFAQTQNSTAITRHRVIQSMSMSSLSTESRDDVHNWDTVIGFNNPPGSPRASSDTTSSTSGSDDEFPPSHLNLIPCHPWDWEIHTEASDWSDSNATVVEPPKPLLKRTRTFDSSATVVVKNVPERIRVPCDPRDREIHTEESDWHVPNAKNELERTPVPPASHPVIKKHYRPRNRHRCERWVLNRCDQGFDCKYVHDDLDYDSDEPEPEIPKRIPESFTSILHTHIRLRLGSGFDVEDITTGFESPFLFLRGLPQDISDQKLNRLLGRFGNVLEIKRISSSSAFFKAEFSKASEAYAAYTSLHGKVEFGCKLDLRLSEEGMTSQTKITDTVVRIDWDTPHLSVFMGFDSMALAEQAIDKASWTPYGDFAVTAAVHVGLPALGKVTVKFDGMPVDVNPKKLEELYGKHDGWMRTAANYMEPSAEDSISGLKKYLKQFGPTLRDVDIRPPPYREGKMRAWAFFATPKDAQAAAERMHGRKPPFSGRTRIMARHLHTIEFNLSLTKYHKTAKDIEDLAQQIWRQGPGYSLAIVDKMSHYVLRLTGENLKVLGRLKSELERRLNGEQLLENGKPVWDEFFGRYIGSLFIEALEREFPGVKIERSTARRTIRIFGSAKDREIVRTRLLEKMAQLDNRGYFVIQLDGRLTNAFINGGHKKLVEKLGADNVILDLWNRTLRVLGDREAQLLAEDAVSVVRMHHKMNYGKKPRPNECPVCFEEVTVPVKLPCGHSWCRACLKRYLQASVDHKLFPLKCLGKEAKCTERVPLYIARDLLSPAEFDAVVQSAFDAHIQTNASQFHFCPTPDCSQVYRPAPAGTFIQCPSCLVRICPSCHTDAHDGLTCAESGSGDDLFQEWVAQHDVKQCPGCKMAIEKDEGCNHMTCAVCKTHLCWVCMKTFKSVDDVYPHMRHAHGGIGL